MERKIFSFTLNIKNIKDIPFHLYEKDFAFHLDGKTYKTSRFLADLLSPTVRRLHYSDNTSNEFYIDTSKSHFSHNPNESKSDSKYFSEFLSLSGFEEAELDDSRQEHYSRYFYLLGNNDEFMNLQNEHMKELNVENAVDYLKCLSVISSDGFGLNSFENCEFLTKVIDFVSMHFEEIDKAKMKKLSVGMIDRIIGNDKLILNDEDSLLRFVLDVYMMSSEASFLFSHVVFKNASRELVEEFIRSFDINHLDSCTWRSLFSRLTSLPVDTCNRYIVKSDTIGGIMQYLTKETGGNIHDNGTIEIKSNSIFQNDNSYHPKNLVDFQKDNFYDSDCDKPSFVCFDFKDKSVSLSSYTIKPNNNSNGLCSPKSWVVEVSNDNNNWEEIDRHENDTSLKGPKIVSTFKVEKQNHRFYRFIRLRQTSSPWERSDHRVWFYSVEFNGKLKKARK